MAVTVNENIPKINERPYFTLTSDKFKTSYTVRHSNDGFVFYEIVCDSGRLAPELSGMYMTFDKAIEAFTLWERLQNKSAAKSRDDKAELREKRKQEETD